MSSFRLGLRGPEKKAHTTARYHSPPPHFSVWEPGAAISSGSALSLTAVRLNILNVRAGAPEERESRDGGGARSGQREARRCARAHADGGP